MENAQINLLDYLRARTQVDLDTFDVHVTREVEQCVDCTSNQQYEYYTELVKQSRRDVLNHAIELAANMHERFPTVPREELTVEIGAILLAMEARPFVTGNMHLMVNPNYAYNQRQTVDAAKRLHRLFHDLDPSFDASRLVLKIAATWEGLQACRELRYSRIQTLATTLFTMEQAILAGEAGCVSISPFVHELKEIFTPSYTGSDPLLPLCVQAQRWFQQQSWPTKVKACATIGLNEILQLAGVAALTLVPDDLKLLQSSHKPADEVQSLSLFSDASALQDQLVYPSYIDDEAGYRMAFARAEEGRAQLKLGQAINIFCDFQTKAEQLVRDARRRDV
ncbi:aldolase [Aspergillus saccharolyticus JOP 1030-1]|uniref:Transaldolase n=1 Tax=Aspergillus saccharolyticus JOP 1030-1 TaxID=1450539 RepID=A0A318Z746_9EURO|nr:aldolase [Aspergillus saccharolyticus JOP 1030-1]PYH42254.1 aldolase [Aspergillus saccharolyticus JOP 1030-1]